MVLSICTLVSNIITYNHDKVKLSDDEINLTISDSKILILIDCFTNSKDFISKKCFRYFSGEKYNLEKTCYLIWNLHIFGYIFNIDRIFEKLHPETKYIKFNNYYNNEPKTLPDTITHIHFGEFFNSSIDCLPYSVEYLYLDKEFDKCIDNLPGCMKKLIFAPNGKFNQSLDNLPNFLEYLILPMYYTKTLDNLPNFLIYIEINEMYEHPLNNLPNSIEKIIFYCVGNGTNKHIIYDYSVGTSPLYYCPEQKIGTNIKIYNIDKIFGKLPSNLKYLDLTFSYKLNLFSNYIDYECISNKNSHQIKEIMKNNQPLDNLPEGLRVLKFPSNYSMIQIDKIPQGIVKLFFSNTFNKSVDKLLNPNFGTNKPKPQTKLTHLVFGSNFNNTVNYLPDSIQYLYFGPAFNKSVNNLPNSLIFISFGSEFNCSVDNLPNNLKHIEFGFDFNCTLDNLKFGIKTIKFKNGHCKKYINKLPSSVEKIYVNDESNISNKYIHLIKKH